MVVRRRAIVMGLVALAALLLAVVYFIRFDTDGGLASLLLGAALLVVGLVHVVAWRESRRALFIADMTGVQVRLAGHWVALPWSDVDRVEVTGRGRLGDGRVAVHSRDERRALPAGFRARVAVLLNRWLYETSLVAPYGLTTTVSVDDMPATLRRLADGRAEIVESDERRTEPEPTVELASTRAFVVAAPPPAVDTVTDAGRPAVGDPAVEADEDADADDWAPAETAEPAEPLEPVEPVEPVEPAARIAPPGRRGLAAVVTALRSQPGRRNALTMPVAAGPAPVGRAPAGPVTAGTLALSASGERADGLPELAELRRRAPEDEAGAPRSYDAGGDLDRIGHVALLHRAVAEPVQRLSPETGDTDIAARLREAREWLGMSVDELADRTRIRPSVIEALEDGDFTLCGGDFYARGHLRMLSGSLGIESAPLLASYDEHVAVAPVSPRAVFDADVSRGVVRSAGGGSRWGALIATVIVILAAWVAVKVFLPGATSDGTTTHGRAGSGIHAAPKAPAIDNPAIGNQLPPPVHITVSASGGSSRVVVRNASMKVIYQGMLQDGESAAVTGRPPLRVMAGDAGVVSLTGPGHPAAVMGPAGKRVYRHVG